MKASNATFEILNQATAIQRAAYVARAEELFMTGLVSMRAKLAAANRLEKAGTIKRENHVANVWRKHAKT